MAELSGRRSPAWEWDDELWERTWEQVLDHVSRHAIAVAVWRRHLPTTHLERRVAIELARRWRRRAISLSVVYGLWTLFWGAIAVSDLRDDGAFTTPLCPVLAVIGLAAVAGCLAFRRRVRGVAAQA